jgi:cytochrome c oxidase subunit 2
MVGTVVAMEPKDYANWEANNGESVLPMTMEQQGQRLYNKVGCNNCHADADTPRAPSLIGIYGTQRVFTDGTSMVANEAYLRESILRPWDHITRGYDDAMPAYDGQLNEIDVLNLIAYIKSMGTHTDRLAPTSMTSPQVAPTTSSGKDVKDILSVNAIQAEHEDPNPTAIKRQGSPAVNAIAAEGNQ